MTNVPLQNQDILFIWLGIFLTGLTVACLALYFRLRIPHGDGNSQPPTAPGAPRIRKPVYPSRFTAQGLQPKNKKNARISPRNIQRHFKLFGKGKKYFDNKK